MVDTSTNLRLRLFGVFTYGENGSEADVLKSRKAEALLLCLALSGGYGFEREHLSRMLWPDSTDEKAKAGLRQALARIRRAFGEVFSAPRKGWISLSRMAVQCDLWDVEDVCANPESGSCDWPTEPFLANYPVINDIFGEWVERTSTAQKQNLKDKLLTALQNSENEMKLRLGCAQSLMLIDSVDEDSVKGVLDFLKASKRVAQYATVLRSYKSRLKSYYDLEPSSDFLLAYDQLPARAPEGEHSPPKALPAELSMRYGKPVLSVEPLEVLIEADELSFLGVGIAEEIVTQISRQDWFSVSTPDSSPVYRHRKVGHHKPHLIFNSYTMSGKISKQAGTVYVFITLLDDSNGAVIWSRQVHSSDNDINSLRSSLASTLAELLASQVMAKEANEAFAINTGDPGDHWAKTMRARYLFWRMSRKNNKEARKLVDEVCEDSDSPSAPTFVVGVFTRLLDVWSLWSKHPENDLDYAVKLAERSVRIHPTEPWVHFALGTALGVAQQLDESILTLDRALSLHPNFAAALGTKGKYQLFAGDMTAAKQNLTAAMQLNDLDTHFGLWQNAMGIAHYLEGEFEAGLNWSEKAISTNRYWAHNYFLSAVCLSHLGRIDKAKRNFRIGSESLNCPTKADLIYSFPFRDEAKADAWFDPLSQLGLRS